MQFTFRIPDNEGEILREYSYKTRRTKTDILREYIRTLPYRSTEPSAAPSAVIDSEIASAVQAYKRGLLSLEELGEVIKAQ